MESKLVSGANHPDILPAIPYPKNQWHQKGNGTRVVHIYQAALKKAKIL
jgi:hypothetical protein